MVDDGRSTVVLPTVDRPSSTIKLSKGFHMTVLAPSKLAMLPADIAA